MADVRIENKAPVVEREVVREQVVDNGGNGAMIIVAFILIAILAVGAFMYLSPSRSPANGVATTVESGVERAGDAVGDAATTTKKTITVN